MHERIKIKRKTTHDARSEKEDSGSEKEKEKKKSRIEQKGYIRHYAELPEKEKADLAKLAEQKSGSSSKDVGSSHDKELSLLEEKERPLSEVVKKANKDSKEYQYLSDISNNLENDKSLGDHSKKFDYSGFRTHVEEFNKILQHAQQILENSEAGIEQQEINQKLAESQNKLDLFQKRYRTEVLEKAMDMNWVTDHFGVGAETSSKNIDVLRLAGIKFVVDMRTDEEGKHDEVAMADAGIELLRLRTRDGTSVTANDLKQGAEWVAERINKREYGLIHCKNGMSRSVQMSMAVLMKAENMTIKDAFRKVQDKRSQASIPMFTELSKFGQQLNEQQLKEST